MELYYKLSDDYVNAHQMTEADPQSRGKLSSCNPNQIKYTQKYIQKCEKPPWIEIQKLKRNGNKIT